MYCVFFIKYYKLFYEISYFNINISRLQTDKEMAVIRLINNGNRINVC